MFGRFSLGNLGVVVGSILTSIGFAAYFFTDNATLNLAGSLRTAIELPEDAPQKAEAQSEARDLINAFASRYRRDPAVSGLASFTTMQTALNGLASHYTSYPNRPVPQKLKDRLDREFKQIELSLKRES